MPVAHELSFHTPIPRGHDVLLVTFGLVDKTAVLVLDRTASNVYCAGALWGPLHQDPALAVTDPVAAVTRYAWKVRSAVEGVCAGALLSTEGWGDRHEVKSILLLEPAAAPYR
jgi:hypothetical protein